MGYRVATGSPCYRPVLFERPHKAVALALNKKAYMNEETLLMRPMTYKLGGTIQNIYRRLTEG